MSYLSILETLTAEEIGTFDYSQAQFHKSIMDGLPPQVKAKHAELINQVNERVASIMKEKGYDVLMKHMRQHEQELLKGRQRRMKKKKYFIETSQRKKPKHEKDVNNSTKESQKDQALPLTLPNKALNFLKNVGISLGIVRRNDPQNEPNIYSPLMDPTQTQELSINK